MLLVYRCLHQPRPGPSGLHVALWVHRTENMSDRSRQAARSENVGQKIETNSDIRRAGREGGGKKGEEKAVAKQESETEMQAGRQVDRQASRVQNE